MRPEDPASPLTWTADGQPRSRLYGDVYFSAENGLAESQAVFLQGCGLPEAWRGRRRFVVGELGFGTGLNILALLDLWRRERPPGARLHVFSVEAHPISVEEARRALAPFDPVQDVAELLLARWPGRGRGFHRVELPEVDAILDLAVMEAAEALGAWTGRADAWFLDGFAPAANPGMWREEVLQLVGGRSAPGARAATFTVAGAVRRGLQAAGFEVAKRPGFGRKRERLEARWPGTPQDAPVREVAVIGAGIAGASAARAVRALGGAVQVFDPRGPAAAASGNPAALVTPRLDAGLGPPARLFAQAFRHAVRLYEALEGAVVGRGVLQLATNERDLGRFAKILGGGLFELGALQLLDAEAASERLGEAAPAALDIASALTIAPAAVVPLWTGEVRPDEVAALRRHGDAWRLLDAAGGVVFEAQAVIVAAGLGSRLLAADLPLAAVRGQVSWAAGVRAKGAAAWGGYAAPSSEGLLFGATHDRGDEGEDLRPSDHARNLATLSAALPRLAAQIRPESVDGRAAVRAVTPDRLPLAGAAVDGAPDLFLLTGFGARGFATAPLLAEHVAALALGAPSPLPEELATLVRPARFKERGARRSAPVGDASSRNLAEGAGPTTRE